MTIQELIELNTLHALGMLDEDERHEFEATLQSASPHVRERVFAEARRLADLGDLLPSDEPSPELREIVISAVRAAITEQNDAQQLAEQAAPAVIATITPQAARAPLGQPAMPRGARVHPVWRAAAIGLAAATVALTVVSAQNRDVYNQLDNQILITELYDAAGAEFVESILMDDNSKRIAMTAVSASDRPTVQPVASVWHNADWGSARLFVKNLRPAPDAEPYRLVVLDSEGNIIREITEFIPTGGLESIDVHINPADANLAIYTANDNQPVLMSSI